jgi:excisionase family DNA binding protein
MPARKRLENTRLTTANIADYCQVTKSTVLVWIRDNNLKAFRLPSGHYRIDVNDFKDFLVKYKMPVRGWPFETK